MQTTTTTSYKATISGSFSVLMDSATTILSNSAVKAKLEQSVAEQVAAKLGNNITATQVSVTVSSHGSDRRLRLRRLNPGSTTTGLLVSYIIDPGVATSGAVKMSSAAIATKMSSQQGSDLVTIVNSALQQTASSEPSVTNLKATSAVHETAAIIQAVPACPGVWQQEACYGGYQASVYKPNQTSVQNSQQCPDVQVATCPHEVQHLNWAYVVPKADWGTNTTHAREIPLVVCPLGSQVSFKWAGSMHNIWKLPDEISYNTCNFSATGAQRVNDKSHSATYDFDCSAVGTYYFACSVGNACSLGSQKVRIYVSDPQKTVALRAKGGLSLEGFNRKYTLLFAGYASNMQSLSNASASDAIQDSNSLLANSPLSCSDWIPQSWLSNQSCMAFVYTDLGFISRVRPTPDYAASEYYYKKALQISPGMCGATSYLAELRVQQNDKASADLEFAKACVACGKYSMDFSDLELAYQKRSWQMPSCSSSTTIDTIASTTAATTATTSISTTTSGSGTTTLSTTSATVATNTAGVATTTTANSSTTATTIVAFSDCSRLQVSPLFVALFTCVALRPLQIF
jgi:hypothetical protein